MTAEAAAPPYATRRVVLLGPQRQPTVDSVARELPDDGPIATVTAGWQEREPDDAELDALLGGRSANLKLYGRWLDLFERDPELAQGLVSHVDLLNELRTLHLVQLQTALATLRALRQRNGDRPAAIDAAVADAEDVVRLLDSRHSDRVREVNAEFDDTMHVAERDAVVEHRHQIRSVLESAAALFVAGGHVGALLRLLRLFAVPECLPETIVAWSAGAMALTERVVLFHDKTPQGPSPAEIYDDGLGILRGLVVLPDARRRLAVDDDTRMAELARRFAPAHCVALDRDDRLDLSPDDSDLPPQARVVAPDGTISPREQQ
jgi:hypothetical protein